VFENRSAPVVAGQEWLPNLVLLPVHFKRGDGVPKASQQSFDVLCQVDPRQYSERKIANMSNMSENKKRENTGCIQIIDHYGREV